MKGKMSNSEFKIFPYFLVRVGSGHFENIKKLNFHEFETDILSFFLKEDERKALKNKLCDKLFEQIKFSKNSKEQNSLLAIKRDLYNDRKLINEKILDLNGLIDVDTLPELKKYIELTENLEEQKRMLNGSFNHNAQQISNQFKKIVNNEIIKEGLLLSSDIFYTEFLKFLEESISDTKKLTNIQLSLLKYVSRIHTKTSPFGVFTNIGYGKITKTETNSFYAINTPYELEQKTRINNFIFRNLLFIWFKHPIYSSHFRLLKNSTIKIVDEKFEYLQYINGVSSIQTIKRNEFIDHLFSLDFDKKILNILSLSDYLIINGFFEQDELHSVVNYIKELIKIGFLDGLDPMWIEKSIVLFENLNKDRVFNCIITIDFLKEIRALMTSFESNSIQDKSKVLDKLAKVLNSYLKEISAEVADLVKDEEGKSSMANIHEFHKPNILKIDTKIKNGLTFNANYAEGVVKKIDQLTGLMARFDYFIKDREAIKNVFLKLYDRQEKISFLKFYVDFTEKYKLPMEKMNSGKETGTLPLDIDFQITLELRKFYEKAEAYFLNSFEIKEPDEVKITLEDIEKELLNNVACEKTRRGSWGIHVQPYLTLSEKGEMGTKTVLNSIFPGYGKLSSRFLYMFDEAHSKTQYEWNSNLSNDKEVFVENKGNNYFNANIHPRMMPIEIYKPGNNRGKEEFEIGIEDLEISYNNAHDKLMLNQISSGKIVNFFDLGFEADASRSDLYWFANLFSIAEWPNFSPIFNSINSAYNIKYQKTKIPYTLWPRVVLNEDIIIQRKTWIIDKRYVPMKEDKESDFDYFLKLKKWQLELSIPDNVFISIPKNNNQENLKKLGSADDDHKPLYISFRSPLFIKLFLKTIRRSIDQIKIIEMLPDLSLVPETDPHHGYPQEFLLQWYKYEGQQ